MRICKIGPGRKTELQKVISKFGNFCLGIKKIGPGAEPLFPIIITPHAHIFHEDIV